MLYSRPNGYLRYAGNTMEAQESEDMGSFQQLSNHYQPDVAGPLIGQKLPMSALMSEYAQADPAYVTKTAALAATHSAYRPVKGDGQCGWRGAVFGYFEILLSSHDPDRVMREKARLEGLDNMMQMADIDVSILSEMFDCTWDLFDSIVQSIRTQRIDENVLLEVLNEKMQSDSIVYHFKMMTSAFMHLRGSQYQPFLEVPMQVYRNTRIQPSNQEIDQIGLQALTEGVIAPAGIAVEVSYLDRSQGVEVTTHRFVQHTGNMPTIRFLYRPGHYDIIYKDSKQFQVHMHNGEMPFQVINTAQFEGPEIDMYSYLFPTQVLYPPRGPSVPNYTTSTNGGGQTQRLVQVNDRVFHPAFMANLDAYAKTPIQAPHHAIGPGQTHQPAIAINSSHSKGTHVFRTSIQQPRSSRLPPSTNPFSSSKGLTSRSPPSDPFRVTHESVKLERNPDAISIPLETESLRRNPSSPAHFLNTEFQPQIWRAEDDYWRS